VRQGETARQPAYQTEHLAARGVERTADSFSYPATSRAADYLDHAQRKMGSPVYQEHECADAGVGFAFHKGSSKMEQAIRNLGRAHVSGIWSYQGSKPFLSKGRMYSPMGDTLQCVDVQSGEVLWKNNLGETAGQGRLLDSVLTPPALVNDKVFIGTAYGEVHCLSAETGTVLWSANVGEPIVFQPVVAQGRVYVGTSSGSLFCLETGEAADDGWFMWGATPAHNGLPDYSFEPVAVGSAKKLLEPV
jgi:hypothetical protein